GRPLRTSSRSYASHRRRPSDGRSGPPCLHRIGRRRGSVLGYLFGCVWADLGLPERDARPANDTAERGAESIPNHNILWSCRSSHNYILWIACSGPSTHAARPPTFGQVASTLAAVSSTTGVELVHAAAAVVDIQGPPRSM